MQGEDTISRGILAGSILKGGSDSRRRESQDLDLRYLEDIGTRDDSLLCSFADDLSYQIKSVREIISLESRAPSLHTNSNGGEAGERVVVLPEHKVATLLVHTYESIVGHLCPIVHIPTVRSLVKTSYVQLNGYHSVPPSEAALLLSIFALAAFFFEPSATSEVATTEADAMQLSKAFSKSALDVLDCSLRNSSGTLEDVQAYIFMSLVMHHMDGFSTRCRLLLTTAASISRDLSLHRLDAGESAAEKEFSVRGLVEGEVKRRIFWYVVTEDWLQSTISGPQEGTYWFQPSHIRVNFPKDCDDDDMVLGEHHRSRSESQPTVMAVFLERLRLAHICREITDNVPLETGGLLQIPYERIIALDQKLQGYLSSIPFFFRLDPESRQNSKALGCVYPQIPVWRYCIFKAALSRRWKLNQRFLLRQSLSPDYSYSRRACVDSARAVIHGYADLVAHQSPSTLLARMGMAVHFTHLALAILVMDLCFTRDEADKADIKLDVKAAFSIFEEAKTVSPLLNQSLASLRAVLQKHEVHLPNTATWIAQSEADGAAEVGRETFEATDGHGVTYNPSESDATRVSLKRLHLTISGKSQHKVTREWTPVHGIVSSACSTISPFNRRAGVAAPIRRHQRSIRGRRVRGLAGAN